MQGPYGLVDQGPVGLGIDLASDDLLDHVHDDLAHAIGRFLDGALARQCHLGLGAGDDALELRLTPGLRVDPHRLGGPVGLGHDLLGRLPRLFERGVTLVVGGQGLGPRLVRRVER